jgi:hypothetical protein
LQTYLLIRGIDREAQSGYLIAYRSTVLPGTLKGDDRRTQLKKTEIVPGEMKPQTFARSVTLDVAELGDTENG